MTIYRLVLIVWFTLFGDCMMEAESNTREATDEFVCYNHDITNQIISDIVRLMVKEDVSPKSVSENEVALELLQTIYHGDTAKRLYSA